MAPYGPKRVAPYHRNSHSESPRSYPDVYYDSVLKILEQLCTAHNNRFKFLTNATIGGRWLLGEIGHYPINDKTYSWLWKFIITAVENDRDDMVMDFWRNANQYASHNLRKIYPDHDYSGRVFEQTNQEEIDIREKERARFLEFTHAIGGLALFKGRYELINKMFTFSNSMPPKYELLPDSMDDVFSRYFDFRDPRHLNFRELSRKYYFPNLRGISGEDILKHWMNKYSALLFLRQYTLTPNLTIDNPIGLPNIPESQSKKRMWQENIDHFKGLIEDVRKNNNLLEALNFTHLNEEHFRENDQISPDDFFENLRAEILEEFEAEEINQELSPEKMEQFYNSTAQILTDTIHEYEAIQNESVIKEDLNNWQVNDVEEIFSKSPFVENQAVFPLNFDTFLAEGQAEKIKYVIYESFRINRSRSYLFKNDDFFKAIDKIIGKSDDAIIVNFGIYLDYLIDDLKINDLSSDNYKDSTLVNFQYTPRGFGRSFFILKKSDLPSFSYVKPEEKIRNKLNLRNINEDYNILASVIDLNQEEELRDELSPNPDDLRSSVYIYIASRLQINWKRSSKVFEIKQFTKFEEKGIPNKLSDIKDSLE